MRDPIERLKGMRILYELTVRVNESGEKKFMFQGKEYSKLSADKLSESDMVLVLRRHGYAPEVAEEGEGDRAECKGCGATIYWRPHPTTGRNHPFNPDGSSHFQTCPEADRFRKRGGRNGGR
jgi:hypothetical protein